ncbi:MAG: thymidylate kinase [Candidatus Thermoplasmatota archaeon]
MRFIVLDGLDAAGKETYARLINRKYEEQGENVVVRSHPSPDNVFGKNAKRALLIGGKLSRPKATLFYTFDILNSLLNYYGKADTVIFVRYLGGVAYFPKPIAENLYTVLSKVFPTSSYMIFLDVDTKDALRRVNRRNKTEMFENEENLKKVKRRALSMMDDWHIVDTSQPIQDAQEDIDKILERLDQKR